MSASPKGAQRAAGERRGLPGRLARCPKVRRASSGEPEAVRFELRREGERLEGLAPGVDRRHLRRLRAGEVEVDLRVDLHGLDRAAAERELREALQGAIEEGARCVLVVHGRGLHSPAGPVIKESLPDWLAAAPIGARVLAFATAGPEAGGAGASYVLLRRSR